MTVGIEDRACWPYCFWPISVPSAFSSFQAASLFLLVGAMPKPAQQTASWCPPGPVGIGRIEYLKPGLPSSVSRYHGPMPKTIAILPSINSGIVPPGSAVIQFVVGATWYLWTASFIHCNAAIVLSLLM